MNEHGAQKQHQQQMSKTKSSGRSRKKEPYNMAHIDYDLWLLMYRALSTFKISATNIDIVASVAVNACIDFRFGHALNFNKSKDCCGNAAVGKNKILSRG